jgi:hypothetical protein
MPRQKCGPAGAFNLINVLDAASKQLSTDSINALIKRLLRAQKPPKFLEKFSLFSS